MALTSRVQKLAGYNARLALIYKTHDLHREIFHNAMYRYIGPVEDDQ
jgi:hypothetical protein